MKNLEKNNIKKTTALTAILLALIFCFAQYLPVMAAEPDSAGNVFDANETVNFPSIPFFGGMAAGRSVTMSDTEASGSVAAAGETVGISHSMINESLYVGGNSVEISESTIGGNIFGAGRNVSVAAEANAAYLTGQTVNFFGTAKNVSISGETVSFDGNVDGDVTLDGENITIGPNSVITGTLKIASTSEPEIPETVSIGSYSFEMKDTAAEDSEDNTPAAKENPFAKTAKKVFFYSIAMTLLAIILRRIFDTHLQKATELLKENPAVMIGRGFAGWVLIPIACILCCFTFILIPLGALTLLLYIVLLCAGLSFTAASVSRMVLPQLNCYLATFICVVVFEIAKQIPYIGFAVAILVDIYLISYVIWYMMNRNNVEEIVEEPISTPVAEAIVTGDATQDPTEK